MVQNIDSWHNRHANWHKWLLHMLEHHLSGWLVTYGQSIWFQLATQWLDKLHTNVKCTETCRRRYCNLLLPICQSPSHIFCIHLKSRATSHEIFPHINRHLFTLTQQFPNVIAQQPFKTRPIYALRLNWHNFWSFACLSYWIIKFSHASNFIYYDGALNFKHHVAIWQIV